MGTSSAWTPERRAKQAEAIKRWRPWDQSTGPKTDAGKAASSRNAYKGYRDQQALLVEMNRARHEVEAIVSAARGGRLVRQGEPLVLDYENSEPFLAAQARYDRASAAYHQLVGLPVHDDDAVADAIMARLEARLRELEDRAADTTPP